MHVGVKLKDIVAHVRFWRFPSFPTSTTPQHNRANRADKKTMKGQCASGCRSALQFYSECDAHVSICAAPAHLQLCPYKLRTDASVI